MKSLMMLQGAGFEDLALQKPQVLIEPKCSEERAIVVWNFFNLIFFHGTLFLFHFLFLTLS